MNSGLGFSPYSASKFAVVNMSEGLAKQVAPLGIGVTVICPGFVRTRISESARNRPERYGPAQTPDPAEPGRRACRPARRTHTAGARPVGCRGSGAHRDPRGGTLRVHASGDARRGRGAVCRHPGGDGQSGGPLTDASGLNVFTYRAYLIKPKEYGSRGRIPWPLSRSIRPRPTCREPVARVEAGEEVVIMRGGEFGRAASRRLQRERANVPPVSLKARYPICPTNFSSRRCPKRSCGAGTEAMKVLVDTHALVWWIIDNPSLSARTRALFADESNEILVSAVDTAPGSRSQGAVGKMAGGAGDRDEHCLGHRRQPLRAAEHHR